MNKRVEPVSLAATYFALGSDVYMKEFGATESSLIQHCGKPESAEKAAQRWQTKENKAVEKAIKNGEL